jgi:hypothetical protein
MQSVPPAKPAHLTQRISLPIAIEGEEVMVRWVAAELHHPIGVV